jgi:hypothetical protein
MQRNSDYIMMAMLFIMSVSLIVAIAVSVGLVVKVSAKDYDLKIIRRDFEERQDREREEYLEAIEELRTTIDSSNYLAKRRYDILLREIELRHQHDNKNKE